MMSRAPTSSPCAARSATSRRAVPVLRDRPDAGDDGVVALVLVGHGRRADEVAQRCHDHRTDGAGTAHHEEDDSG